MVKGPADQSGWWRYGVSWKGNKTASIFFLLSLGFVLQSWLIPIFKHSNSFVHLFFMSPSFFKIFHRAFTVFDWWLFSFLAFKGHCSLNCFKQSKHKNWLGLVAKSYSWVSGVKSIHCCCAGITTKCIIGSVSCEWQLPFLLFYLSLFACSRNLTYVESPWMAGLSLCPQR